MHQGCHVNFGYAMVSLECHSSERCCAMPEAVPALLSRMKHKTQIPEHIMLAVVL
jgi:hypothetical protein